MVSKRDAELLIGIIVSAFLIVSLISPMLPEFGINFRELTGQVIPGSTATSIVCHSGSSGDCPVPGSECAGAICDYPTCDCVVNQDLLVRSGFTYTFKSLKINFGRTVSVQAETPEGTNGVNTIPRGGAGGSGGGWCCGQEALGGGGGGGPGANGYGAGRNSGGGGCGGVATGGGMGGGNINITADTIDIQGSLIANGGNGNAGCGGGGAGMIVLNVDSISVSGALTAIGGNGGAKGSLNCGWSGCNVVCPGGGGGGGYIRINYGGVLDVTGTISPNGGFSGGTNCWPYAQTGGAGTIEYATSDVEECFNGVDDDSDTFVDCADPDCVNSACNVTGCTAAGCSPNICKQMEFSDKSPANFQKCCPSSNNCADTCTSDCPGGVTPDTGNYITCRSEGYERNDNYVCLKGKFYPCNASFVDTTQKNSAGATYYCCEDGSSYSWRTVPCAVNLGPTYSSNSVSSTLAGSSVGFRLKWASSTGLSGYIFSIDNCTGSFVNSTYVNMTGTGNWSNVTKTINSTVGCTVRWRVYANDVTNIWTTSEIFSFITTSAQLQFNVSWFNCSAISNGFTCRIEYDNKMSENGVFVFLYTNSQGKVISAAAPVVGTGTGISSSNLYCTTFGAGTYKVGWMLFKQSDTSQANPISWSISSEEKQIVCS